MDRLFKVGNLGKGPNCEPKCIQGLWAVELARKKGPFASSREMNMGSPEMRDGSMLWLNECPFVQTDSAGSSPRKAYLRILRA